MKLSGAAQRQLSLEAAGHGLCGHQEPDSGLRLSDWPAAGREHTISFLPVIICSPVMWGSNCCHFIKLLLGLDELMQQAWQLTQEKGATLFYFWIPLPSTHFLYVKLSQGVISQGQGIDQQDTLWGSLPCRRSRCRPQQTPCLWSVVQEEEIIGCHIRNAGVFVSWHMYFHSYDPNTSITQMNAGSAGSARHLDQCFHFAIL